MRTRKFGSTDLLVTPIGFGAWGLGGANWFSSKGPQDDSESIRTIHRALDAGINWIDTAPSYGLGHSEDVIARALRGISNRPYIFTKCGIEWNDRGEYVGGNLSPDFIRKECEDSLRRLEVETIDLYQIHKPWPDEGIEEAWRTLLDLQKSGKVRFIGVTTFDVNQLTRIMSIAPVVSDQPRYSLLYRDAESEILPYCEQRNIAVIVDSPMARGLLSGKITRDYVNSLPDDFPWRNEADYAEPRITYILNLINLLREIGIEHGCSIGEVAVSWVLRHPAVTGAIVGFRKPEHVDAILGAVELDLTDDEIQSIETRLAFNNQIAG